MEWKHCKWCGRWIGPGKDIHCKMCKEYFDTYPDRIVRHGKIVVKKEGI